MIMPLQRVLYVEDDPSIQTVVKLALELVGGYQVEVCDSGRAAIAALQRFRPQLALLDVMMPGMDGPTTLQHLREQFGFERLPAIFMTAKVQPAEVAVLKSQGALGVIAKPFDPMTLGGELERLWAGQPG